MDIFTVDGKPYDVEVMELKRKAIITDTENSGRTLDGEMHRDIIGTYYNYSLKVEPKYSDYAAYDELYELLTAPVKSHEIVMPYAQSTLVFKAYVTSAEDTLQIRNGINHWGQDGLTIDFIAMAPQRRV